MCSVKQADKVTVLEVSLHDVRLKVFDVLFLTFEAGYDFVKELSQFRAVVLRLERVKESV